ncbi:unnamed protein product [Arctia plantaginis]|uniref:BEN domain-containing protein n=1 Tax=Arctia plantaginis TaxID=874455 RepID=A0A8S1BMA1_ARCPL|nr:unnamed protein product [Arctia plantaginis]CAB3239908.1 unnamed protein product [Arctia plantaginis]CAB3261416.1 unnamed protein product [Arctia plantaginis]
MPKRSWSPENSPPPKKLKISKNMKNIGNNVYCRKIIYDSALGASHKSTHLARRLLEGVFNHDAMMGCTLTGQAPRTKDKKSAVVNPLDQQAKGAIVEFAMHTAVERKWPIQSRQIILKEMSQRSLNINATT